MTDPKILYRCYLLGRLGADGGDPRELSLDELAALALGYGDLHRSGIRSAAQVAADVAALVPTALVAAQSEPAERPSPWEPPPHASPDDRPSPPTARCHCRPTEDSVGRPRAHARRCPDYSLEDEAYCRTWYQDALTGKAPSYAEALAAVRQAAELRHRYSVPSKYITVTLPARTDAELLDSLGDGLRAALRAQAEIKARHIAGQRCGTCPQCRGLMADPRCRHERVVVERDAVRRAWCHVQAINPAALDPMGARIYGLLVDEVGKLAVDAGVK